MGSLVYGIAILVFGLVAIRLFVGQGRPARNEQQSSFGLATGAAPWWKHKRGR